MANHIGTYDGIVLQPRERWSQKSGRVTEPRRKLLNSSVAAYTASLRSAGYSYEVEPLGESPYSIVTTLAISEDAGAETVLADLWELDGNDLEKSIWELPAVVALFGSGSDPKAKAEFRGLVDEFARGEYDGTYAEFLAEAGGALLGGSGALTTEDQATVESLVNSITAGVEAFTVSAYVLRRTITLPANTTLAPAFTNSNKIYTTAALKAFETSIPLNLANTLPDGFWQKKTPTASQQSDGRWVYKVEYWWAEEYDTFLYETAS